METDGRADDLATAQLREQLREIERGEAASWLAWQTTSWWHPPFFAGWAAVFVLNVGLFGDLGSIGVNFALILAACAVVGLERRRRGTWPERSMPRELYVPVTWSTAGFVVLLVLGWATAAFSGFVWSVAAAVSAATYLLMWTYSRAYERACVRVRERLAGAA